MLEHEAEAFGGAAGEDEQVRIVGLRQVDHALVVGEVHGLELRVAIDSEPSDHESLKVAGEEIRQPERARLVRSHRGEDRRPGEELVAMGAGEALDAFGRQDRVEQAAGPAVGVGDEDPLVAVAPRLVDAGTDGARDAAGAVVEIGRQARDVDTREGRRDLDELAGEGAAADHDGGSSLGTPPPRRLDIDAIDISGARDGIDGPVDCSRRIVERGPGSPGGPGAALWPPNLPV